MRADAPYSRATLSRLGYTLVEALIALVVIGAVMIVAVHQSLRADPARALALYQTANKMAQAWEQIASDCGVDNATSNAIGSGKALNVLINGAAAASTAYQSCVRSGIIRQFSDEIGKDAQGNPLVQNYPVKFTGGGPNPLDIQYTGVSPEVTAALVGRFAMHPVVYPIDNDPQLGTDARVRAVKDAAGTYTVDILFPAGSPAVATATDSNPATAAAPVPVMVASVTPPASSSTSGGAAPPSLPAPPALPGGSSGGATSGGSSGGATSGGSSGGATSGGSSGGATSGGSSGGATSGGSSSGTTSGGTTSGGGTSGKHPPPANPTPAQLGIGCGSWNGTTATIDGGDYFTVHYSGYNASNMSAFSFTPDTSQLTGTGGTGNATVKGTNKSLGAKLEYCMAQRTYTWNPATNSWNSPSWATVDFSMSFGVANSNFCFAPSTTTSPNSASANGMGGC